MTSPQNTSPEPYHFPHDEKACPDTYLKWVLETDCFELGAEAAAELKYRHPAATR